MNYFDMHEPFFDFSQLQLGKTALFSEHFRSQLTMSVKKSEVPGEWLADVARA